MVLYILRTFELFITYVPLIFIHRAFVMLRHNVRPKLLTNKIKWQLPAAIWGRLKCIILI